MKNIFLIGLVLAIVVLAALPTMSNAADSGFSIGVGGGGFSFGVGSGSSAGGAYGGATGGGWSLGNLGGFGLPASSVSGVIRNLLMWILMIFGLIGIIGFVISGIMYILAAGEEGTIERAKTAMTWSIVGVVVGLLGVVIIQAVDFALRGFSSF